MKVAVAWPHLLALTIFLGSMPMLDAAKDARTLFKTSAPSVVLIKTYASGHVPLKIGSGFFVATGKTLITNAHVIAGAVEVEVVRSDGVTVPVTEVLALAPAHDLAILSASGPPLQLSERKVEVGDTVFALGNPKGLSATFSDGMVSALRKLDDTSVIQITAPISPGSSGGPILDENGLVVGVASFGYKEGQNLNFAISSSNLVPLLAALKSMPLATATGKLETIKTQGTFAHGADRLVVVRSSLNNSGNLSVVIKNTETYPVYQILLRVLFYEDRRQAKLVENRQESGSINASLAVFGRAAQILQIRTILDKDFNTWTTDQLALLSEFDGSATDEVATMIRMIRGPILTEMARDRAVERVREKIAEIKRKIDKSQNEIGDGKNAGQESEMRAQLVKLEVERKQIDGLPKPEDLLLVDYADYVLDEAIAPGLTKTFEVKGKVGIAKPVIVDYLIVGK